MLKRFTPSCTSNTVAFSANKHRTQLTSKLSNFSGFAIMPFPNTRSGGNNKRAAQRKAETAANKRRNPGKGAAAARERGRKLVTPTQAKQAAEAARRAAAEAKEKAAAAKAAEKAARKEAGRRSERAKFDRFVKWAASSVGQPGAQKGHFKTKFSDLKLQFFTYMEAMECIMSLLGAKVIKDGKVLDDYIPSEEQDDEGAAGVV
jgi:hypothetical protein